MGDGRLIRRLFTWWHWTDGWAMESQAVAVGRAGHHDAMRAHTEGKKTRGTRGRIVAVTAALGLFGLLLAVRDIPLWGWPVTGVVLVLVLARHGKPEGTPIVRRAIVPTAYEAPTPEVITRALGSLGIGAVNKVIESGRGLAFVSDVHRDGEGWGCDLDLPHGVTAADIIKRREALASGLRRPLSATWPKAVPHEHEGRSRLWVGFHDISKAKPKPWPLLRSGTADVFGALPFGTDPRGRILATHAGHVDPLTLILADAAALAVYVLVAFARPVKTCGKCHGRGNVHLPNGTAPVCPRCHGQRRHYRAGATLIHRIYQDAQRERHRRLPTPQTNQHREEDN